MPCSTFPIDPAIGPVTEIGIAFPLSQQAAGAAPPAIHWIKAIADTGCSHTCIHSSVATKAGLPVISKAQVNSTTTQVTVDVYLADLFIKCTWGTGTLDFPLRDRRVSQLMNTLPNCEALFGMDVMGMGHFSVNGLLKMATFCF